MNKRTLIAAAAFAIVSSSFAQTGTVYTSSNQASGNAILAFKRGNDGKLTPNGSYPTGGLGTGGGLGNQGAVTLSDDGRHLYAVNAGSNTLSVFQVTKKGLQLADQISTDGVRPISVTQKGGVVYVLNAGDAQNAGGIHGYWQLGNRLIDLPGSDAPLSAASVGPAQIQFNPASRNLVVTEKGTNLIDLFELNSRGQVVGSSYNPSSGQTPFGFDFDQRGRFFVSEAFGGAVNGSAVSSYRVQKDDLNLASPSVPTTETAACWVVVTRNGRYAYATNAGSSSISGYNIAQDGTITLLNADGVTASTGAGSSPNDVAVSRDGRYLYAKTNGAQNILSFRILSNGQLEKIDEDGGLPIGTNGLAAH